jgi:hypothetical protein
MKAMGDSGAGECVGILRFAQNDLPLSFVGMIWAELRVGVVGVFHRI